LSLLELGKMGFVSLFQTEAYADIYIEAKKVVDGDVVSRVEEYNSVNSEATADKMIADSAKDDTALDDTDIAADDFVLRDAEDAEQMALVPVAAAEIGVLEEELTDDMASDDEIMAAETELFNADESPEGGTLG
jgi:segregation and condensation protein A